MPMAARKNRRDFATLDGDTGGDGMAIDNAGRIYVTASKGVHVLAKDGKHLGLIPTPRAPISLTFSGPNKKTLLRRDDGCLRRRRKTLERAARRA